MDIFLLGAKAMVENENNLIRQSRLKSCNKKRPKG